jgi:hypothetical protein
VVAERGGAGDGGIASRDGGLASVPTIKIRVVGGPVAVMSSDEFSFYKSFGRSTGLAAGW